MPSCRPSPYRPFTPKAEFPALTGDHPPSGERASQAAQAGPWASALLGNMTFSSRTDSTKARDQPWTPFTRHHSPPRLPGRRSWVSGLNQNFPPQDSQVHWTTSARDPGPGPCFLHLTFAPLEPPWPLASYVIFRLFNRFRNKDDAGYEFPSWLFFFTLMIPFAALIPQSFTHLQTESCAHSLCLVRSSLLLLLETFNFDDQPIKTKSLSWSHTSVDQAWSEPVLKRYTTPGSSQECFKTFSYSYPSSVGFLLYKTIPSYCFGHDYTNKEGYQSTRFVQRTVSIDITHSVVPTVKDSAPKKPLAERSWCPRGQAQGSQTVAGRWAAVTRPLWMQNRQLPGEPWSQSTGKHAFSLNSPHRLFQRNRKASSKV